MRYFILSATLLIPMAFGRLTSASELSKAGYAALPAPQHVELTGKSFKIDSRWHLQIDAPIQANDAAIEAIREGLAKRHDIQLAPNGNGPMIRLTIRPGAVNIGPAQDADKQSLQDQAYQLELSDRGIHVIANAPPGLFYGVETLVQFVNDRDKASWLPTGTITDWPDLQLRQIYWDDAHHLEKMEAFKHAIRQGAFYKINGFVLKLEGHFQYPSAPALVEPQALSPAQLQELTDYASRYYVQLIPYLDAPAHIAFILKHPEYAPLRAFPDSNYELCTTNPRSYDLLYGMYQDLLDANRGVKYFYLSTDEPYYVGLSHNAQCDEASELHKLGSPGKVLAQFVTKAAGYLHDRGRTVIFWGEHPMKPADVPAFPSYLINGETLDPKFDAAFRARGIRQTFYTSTEGEEPLFPDYSVLPASRRLHARSGIKPRIPDAIATIASPVTRQKADLMGAIVAGWADAGLHPETFWRGYVTIAAAGWNPHDFDEADATTSFDRLFHGSSARNMDRIYELLSRQAQAWADSWESAPSKLRKPIWGNSEGPFNPRHPAHDQVLPLPPAPAGDDLHLSSNWRLTNAKRLELAKLALAENDELLNLLNENQKTAQFNRYTLEVFTSIAGLCRQNLQMLLQIERMDALLASAHEKAAANARMDAIAALDQAISLANQMRHARNSALKQATDVFYKTWLPRVPQANGRTFLHEVDDVKDHLPDRTIGMEYLIYRELNCPIGQWVAQIQSARNAYARSHHLQETNEPFDWKQLN